MKSLEKNSRDYHVQKIKEAKEELKKAGVMHKRDLIKHIHRMEKELLIYDRYQMEARRG